ncbi:MAG: exopolysaccharide biosynthesis protein [Verrucomicrobiota bacterium]|nr:exopolysaccharide biosynthesis protein [Verrucomicrobiota bacterium]
MRVTRNTRPRHRVRVPLSVVLAQLSVRAAQHTLTLQSIVVALHGRSYLVLVALLALPFCCPIPLMGLSSPFGIAIAYIGLHLSISERVYLSRRLRRIEVPSRFFPALIRGAGKLLAWLEKVIRPRAFWVGEQWFVQRATGVAICISGLLLMLPLPIPFSNSVPAIAIVILALSRAEDDGIGLLVGGLLFLFSLGFFILLGLGSAEIYDRVLQWW